MPLPIFVSCGATHRECAPVFSELEREGAFRASTGALPLQGRHVVPKDSLLNEIKRKAEALDYELDAHRWLLYFAIFQLLFGIIAAWTIADLRDGIVASADGQKRIYKEMSILQQQITAIRRDMPMASVDGRVKERASGPTGEGNILNPVPPPAAVDQSRAGRPDSVPPKQRAHP